jgi:release factor glutamine methyltransferase
VTVGEALRRAAARLADAGAPSPRVDAEHLLGKALNATRTALYADPGRALTPSELTDFHALVERRARREPLAYVLGGWGFRRLTLAVDRRVLIPRPETEVVVERCLARLAGRDAPRVLDVGTGSGAIALAIADEHPGARVTGIDASPDALALARENAAATGLAVELREWDLETDLPPGPWELVVSNPPYVAPGEVATLEPEVRDWEPRSALVGEGLHERVAAAARDVLGRDGWIVLEVGDGQARAVAACLEELGYADVTITRDLAGRERVLEGRSG